MSNSVARSLGIFLLQLCGKTSEPEATTSSNARFGTNLTRCCRRCPHSQRLFALEWSKTPGHPGWRPFFGGDEDRNRGVVAEMSHGYAVWPEDLLDVIKDLVTAARPGGVQAVTIGDKRVQFEDSLTPRQLSTLDRYRIEHP